MKKWGEMSRAPQEEKKQLCINCMCLHEMHATNLLLNSCNAKHPNLLVTVGWWFFCPLDVVITGRWLRFRRNIDIRQVDNRNEVKNLSTKFMISLADCSPNSFKAISFQTRMYTHWLNTRRLLLLDSSYSFCSLSRLHAARSVRMKLIDISLASQNHAEPGEEVNSRNTCCSSTRIDLNILKCMQP